MNPYEVFEKASFRLRRQCGKCQYRVPIEVAVYSESLADLNLNTGDAITDQQTKDGWKDGYCPQCAFEYADELAAIAKADEDQSE